MVYGTHMIYFQQVQHYCIYIINDIFSFCFALVSERICSRSRMASMRKALEKGTVNVDYFGIFFCQFYTSLKILYL